MRKMEDAVQSYCVSGGDHTILWQAFCNAYPFLFQNVKVTCNQDQIRVTRFILMLLFEPKFIYLEVLKMITTKLMKNNYKLNRFSVFFGSATHHEALPLASAIIEKARFNGKTKLVVPYFDWLLKQGVDPNFNFRSGCSTFCYAFIYAKDKKSCIFLESMFKSGHQFNDCKIKYHNRLPCNTLADIKMLRSYSKNIKQWDILRKLMELKRICSCRYNNISTECINSMVQYLKVWLFSIQDKNKPATLYETALYSTLENCTNVDQLDFLPNFILKNISEKNIEITKMCTRNGLI
jgi:hypothetical protein